MASEIINHRWWTDKDPSAALAASCDDIASREKWRTAELLRSWRLYSGRKWANLRQIGRTNHVSYETTNDRVRYNVIASIVETIVAKLSKNRPAPSFVTNGADWKTRRMTGKLNKFGKGVLHASGVYDQLDEILKEWAVCGTTALKFCADEGEKKIYAERAFLWELFVPSWEAERGSPKTLMQRTQVDRAALEERFGTGAGKEKRLAAIRMCGPQTTLDANVGIADDGSDLVTVYEGWRLGSDGKPGRHVICVSQGVLLDEEWTRPAFPFAFAKYSKLPGSFWGVGVAHRQAGKQFEINNLLQKIQQNTHMLANPTTFVEANSGIPEAHLTNDIGAVVKLAPGGAPPTRLVLPIMPAEVYNQVETYKRDAYEEEGVSQLSASARKPAGLDSLPSLREFSDIESERFLPQGHEVERFIIECVDRCIELAEDIPGYEVDTMDRRANERMKWKDIKVARDSFVLLCFPVSSLPQNPAARRQTVQEYAQAGWITVDKAKELLDFPDLEENESVEGASMHFVRKQVEKILDGEKASPPDPRMNLAQALPWILGVYMRERANGCPEDILERLRTYLSQVEAFEAAARQAAQPQQPMAPPGGGEVPPPVAMA